MITDPDVTLKRIERIVTSDLDDDTVAMAAFGAICGCCSAIEEFLEYSEHPQKKYTFERLRRLRAQAAAICGFDAQGGVSLGEHRQKALESMAQVRSGL